MSEANKCQKCGGWLLFSARQLGTGFCHYCAHKDYVRLAAEAEQLRAELDELREGLLQAGWDRDLLT